MRLLPADPELPELSLRLADATAVAHGNGRKFDVRIDVLNTSPFPTDSGAETKLYASIDNVLDEGDALVASASTPALTPYGTRRMRLRGSDAAAPDAAFLIVVADADDEIEEGDEENNVVWERIAP